MKLHLKEVEKSGTRIEIESSGYNLAGFDLCKCEILVKLKRVSYKDLEDLVYSMKLS